MMLFRIHFFDLKSDVPKINTNVMKNIFILRKFQIESPRKA